MPRPTMDRDRLATLAESWEPTQRFTRDDINALLALLDASETEIAELKGRVARAEKAVESRDRLHGDCNERIAALEADLARASRVRAKTVDVAERMRRVNGVIANLLTELP